MEKIIVVLGTIFLAALLFLLAALLFAAPFMWIWNAVMPDLFNLTKITFFQSLGLLVLASMLFKSNSSKKD